MVSLENVSIVLTDSDGSPVRFWFRGPETMQFLRFELINDASSSNISSPRNVVVFLDATVLYSLPQKGLHVGLPQKCLPVRLRPKSIVRSTISSVSSITSDPVTVIEVPRGRSNYSKLELPEVELRCKPLPVSDESSSVSIDALDVNVVGENSKSLVVETPKVKKFISFLDPVLTPSEIYCSNLDVSSSATRLPILKKVSADVNVSDPILDSDPIVDLELLRKYEKSAHKLFKRRNIRYEPRPVMETVDIQFFYGYKIDITQLPTVPSGFCHSLRFWLCVRYIETMLINKHAFCYSKICFGFGIPVASVKRVVKYNLKHPDSLKTPMYYNLLSPDESKIYKREKLIVNFGRFSDILNYIQEQY